MKDYGGITPAENLYLWQYQRHYQAFEIILSTNPHTACGQSLDEMAEVIGISPRKDLEVDTDLRERIIERLNS
jgi:hypothetical protein